MNLHKAASTLTIALSCVLPLAAATGCTGPPRGTGNNVTGNSTNTSQPIEIDDPPFSDVYSNTTN